MELISLYRKSLDRFSRSLFNPAAATYLFSRLPLFLEEFYVAVLEMGTLYYSTILSGLPDDDRHVDKFPLLRERRGTISEICLYSRAFCSGSGLVL